MKIFRLLTWGACLVALSACSHIGVKPWQRDLMSQEAMRPDGYPIDSGFDDHIYFSKEATSGGRSAAGGGCGCN